MVKSCIKCSNKKIAARGLCRNCYYKERDKGILHLYNKKSSLDSFESKFTKTDSCWIWNATKNQFGYGVFILDNKVIRAHRHSYEKYKGPIPENMVVMHSCDIPSCVNPNHLSIGTRSENNKDAVSKRRNAFGEKNGHSKLSYEDVLFIKDSQETNSKLAIRFNVNQSTISRIKANLRRSKG